MQRKQVLAEIDRQSKQWEKDIGTHNQDYRQGFRDGVNRVKELISARLPSGQTNEGGEVNAAHQPPSAEAVARRAEPGA